jgi:hypothetical protein
MVKPAKPTPPINIVFTEKDWQHVNQILNNMTVSKRERLLWAMLAITEFRLGLGKAAFELMTISTWIRGQLVTQHGLNLDTLMLRAQQRVDRKHVQVKKKAAADKALLKRAVQTLERKPKKPKPP